MLARCVTRTACGFRRTAERSLLAEWDRCRWVWNQCVEASNAAHRESVETGVKAQCGPAQLDKRLTGWRGEREWLSGGSSVAQQQTIRDFGRARAKALQDRTDRKLSPRQRRGMPKFKSTHRAAPSLNYTLRGFVLDGRLVRLAGGIVVRPVWSRDLPCAPSSVRISRDALGRWWCSFVVARPETELVARDGPVDRDRLGCDRCGDHDQRRSRSTASAAWPTGRAVRLARYQRMMARRKPVKGQAGSRGYTTAKRAAAKQYAHVAAQRADAGRKWAKAVATDFDQIAVEDFRPKFLAEVDDGAQSRRRRDRRDQTGVDRTGRQTRPPGGFGRPEAHHHRLRKLRCESQTPPAAVATHLPVRALRTPRPTRQELRTRHTQPGRFQPGWCRRHKTRPLTERAGSLSQESRSFMSGRIQHPAIARTKRSRDTRCSVTGSGARWNPSLSLLGRPSPPDADAPPSSSDARVRGRKSSTFSCLGRLSVPSATLKAAQERTVVRVPGPSSRQPRDHRTVPQGKSRHATRASGGRPRVALPETAEVTEQELSAADAALRERITELSVHIPCGGIRGPLQQRSRSHPDLPVRWQSCRDEDFPEKWEGCDVSREYDLCAICFRATAGGRSRWAWIACEDCREVNAGIERVWGSRPFALGRHSLMNGIGVRGGSSPEVAKATNGAARGVREG